MNNKTIGRIYKISSSQCDKCYIGSTRRTIKKRFSGHKANDNKTASSEIIKYGDAKIELLEEVENINDLELRKLEQKYLDENDCVNIKKAIYNKLEYDRLYHKNRRRNMKSSWITL